MITKGSKIKLIKPMGVFKNVGEICDVTFIGDDGSICFKFGGQNLGFMSHNEFKEYFEIAENKKHEWSELKKYYDTCSDELFYYRENGVRVIVKKNGIKAMSTCHKIDNFDLTKGLKLSMARWYVKNYKHQLDEVLKELSE